MSDKLTVQRIPKEDSASQQAASDFVHPGVVKCHPGRTVLHLAGFGSIPHVGILEVAVPVRRQVSRLVISN
jgi:hypothetical protein